MGISPIFLCYMAADWASANGKGKSNHIYIGKHVLMILMYVSREDRMAMKYVHKY